MRFYFSLHIFLSVVLWAGALRADLAVPSAPQSYMNDYANLISPAEKQALEQKLKAFEESDSTQVFVAIFPSLEGESLEDFSMRLAEKWKAGQKNKDNGVILLIFKNDRKLRIEVGYGLEPVLTDAISSSIIQRQIVPYFKQGLYSAGISSGVDAILQAVQGQYQGAGPAKSNSEEDSFNWGFLFFLLIFLILPPFFRRGRVGGITFSSGGWGGGGGGFSGGGGGSFGGGGSSGSW